MKSAGILKVLAIAGMVGGCTSYYEETGLSIMIGDVSAPVDVSDPTGSLTARALYSLDGMKLWASRGRTVYFSYDHTYTNSYLFGMVEKAGDQRGEALVADGTNDMMRVNAEVEGMHKGR